MKTNNLRPDNYIKVTSLSIAEADSFWYALGKKPILPKDGAIKEPVPVELKKINRWWKKD